MTSEERRATLRAWIARRSGRIRVEQLRDDTPLLEQRILTSLDVMELILFLESLSGHAVEPTQLQPGAFRDIDTLCSRFLEAGAGPR